MGKIKKPLYSATMVVCDRIVKKYKSDSQTIESLQILNEMCLINGTKVLFDNTSQCNPVRICSVLGYKEIEEDWTMFGSPIREIDYGNVIRWWPSSILTSTEGQIRIEFPTFELMLNVLHDSEVSSRFFEDININEEKDLKEDPKGEETMSDERVYGSVSEENEAVETTTTETTKKKFKLPKKSWVKIGIAAAAVAAAVVATVVLLKKKNENGSETGSEATTSE